MVGINNPATDRPFDLRRDTRSDAEAQVDAGALALAATFGTVSFPPDMPKTVRDAILTRAEQSRDAAGDFVVSGRQRVGREEAEKDREVVLDQWAQLINDQRREADNKAAWLSASHTYAGRTLSGKDWEELRNWFGNDDNVAVWEDSMMAETGQSREEVRRTGGKMKRFYELMEKDGNGTLTEHERAEFDRLNDDPDLKIGIDVQQEIKRMRADHSVRSEGTDARQDGKQDNRALARAELDKDSGPSSRLGNVPSITPVHAAAADPKPVEIEPEVAPALAAQTVKLSPDNMFG